MKYYNAQGLDENKLRAYDKVAEKMDIAFFFIDEENGDILCTTYEEMNKETNTLDEKRQQYVTYPNCNVLASHHIVLYDASTMKRVGRISPAQQNALKQLSNRNY